MKIRSNWNSQTLLVEMQNDTATSRTSLAVSGKIEHTLRIQPSNPTSRYLSKRNKNSCSHKNLYTNVYNSFIHNCKNWNNQSFNGEWINCGYIHTMLYLLKKKEWVTDTHKHGWSLNAFCYMKEPVSKRHTLYDYILWHFIKDKTLGMENRLVIVRAWE